MQKHAYYLGLRAVEKQPVEDNSTNRLLDNPPPITREMTSLSTNHTSDNSTNRLLDNPPPITHEMTSLCTNHTSDNSTNRLLDNPRIQEYLNTKRKKEERKEKKTKIEANDNGKDSI